MTAAMHEEWRPPPGEPPRLTEVSPPPGRPPGWVLLGVFPLSVLLTVFAIGGADGRTPASVRVEVRDASGDLALAGQVADRLAAAGIEVVSVQPVRGGAAVHRTEMRYHGNSEEAMNRAKAVRRALGTGTIVRTSGAREGVDVTLIIGKDVQNE